MFPSAHTKAAVQYDPTLFTNALDALNAHLAGHPAPPGARMELGFSMIRAALLALPRSDARTLRPLLVEKIDCIVQEADNDVDADAMN